MDSENFFEGAAPAFDEDLGSDDEEGDSGGEGAEWAASQKQAREREERAKGAGAGANPRS